MNAPAQDIPREPIGRIMSTISRVFYIDLQQKLKHLDIDRSFYPLLLIESGNGKMTQQDLANKLACDKVQVVRIVDYLSLNGYVTRTKNLNDRRKLNLEITSKAREILPDVKKAIDETSSLALEGIEIAKVEELYTTLHIIKKNLSRVKNTIEV
jgi:MarR family transcriptional regulator, transcriptional regulator for hemolysin